MGMNFTWQNRWFRFEFEIYRDAPRCARYHVAARRVERALHRQLWRGFRAALQGRTAAEGPPT
jgi:hypothetical protein